MQTISIPIVMIVVIAAAADPVVVVDKRILHGIKSIKVAKSQSHNATNSPRAIA